MLTEQLESLEEVFPKHTFPINMLDCGLEAVPEYHVVWICHVSELAHVSMICREILGTFARETHHCGRFIDNHETSSRYSFKE